MSVLEFPSSRRNLRVALYSHDTVGLGHLRRNVRLAEALTADGGTDVLIVCGAREVGRFPLPPRTDAVTVPGVAKTSAGTYLPRALSGDLRDVLRLRADVIRASFTSFDPDVLIVDKVALGLGGELRPALSALRDAGTRIVLGLRDILDEPEVARCEWQRDDTTAAIERFYDEVWIYGDPTVHDLRRAVGSPPELVNRSVHTGYLCPPPATGYPRSRGSDGSLVLCLVGGGQDGNALLDAFLRCELPRGTTGLAIAGPYLPHEELARIRTLAAGAPDRAVRAFTDDIEPLLDRADRVIAMAGYNTVCELLARSLPVLHVPRVRPRTEQRVRAERLAELGWCDVLHPDELSPGRLSAWLATPPPPTHARAPIDVDGLARVRGLVDRLIAEPRTHQPLVLEEAHLVLD